MASWRFPGMQQPVSVSAAITFLRGTPDSRRKCGEPGLFPVLNTVHGMIMIDGWVKSSNCNLNGSPVLDYDTIHMVNIGT
jgi:hypothetical protein